MTPDEQQEVYLDYAGSALPTRSQLRNIFKGEYHCPQSQVLANPHSMGPAAARTLSEIERVKKRILDHFHATPGRFAGMTNPPPSPIGDSAASSSRETNTKL